jgi:hypothetical protein
MQFLVFIALPVLLLLAAFLALEVWLWWRGPAGKLICIVLFAGLVLGIYTDIHPSESFYRAKFSEVTGQDFPASGRFIFKETSAYDIHGDHTSCAVIEVSESDYEALHSKIEARSAYRAEDKCMYHLWETLAGAEFLAESSECASGGECTYWALVAGRPEVVIHYASW